MAVLDGRSLVPSADGAPLQVMELSRHVVLVHVEELGAAMVVAGETPGQHLWRARLRDSQRWCL